MIVSYRPTNCSFNLNQVAIRQNTTTSISVNSIQRATPPVIGTIDISWNNISITSINYNLN